MSGVWTTVVFVWLALVLIQWQCFHAITKVFQENEQ